MNGNLELCDVHETLQSLESYCQPPFICFRTDLDVYGDDDVGTSFVLGQSACSQLDYLWLTMHTYNVQHESISIWQQKRGAHMPMRKFLSRY